MGKTITKVIIFNQHLLGENRMVQPQLSGVMREFSKGLIRWPAFLP
jgi:hypothetical protein